MSFDRKAYKQATLAALAASRTYNREDALMEMLLNEAEARHNAENKSTPESKSLYTSMNNERRSYTDAVSYHYRHSDEDIPSSRSEYAPHLREDLERVKRDPSLRGTPSDPDNGSYCTACGHYHYGMC